jgi:ribonucleoside-diphosphate reductase alpha chain
MQPVPTDERIPLSDNARRVLDHRYLQKDEDGIPTETPAEMFQRVAANVSCAEGLYGGDEASRREWESAFYGLMTRMEFLPNSPTLMNAGTDIQQLSACFVLPVEDSMDGIFESIKQTALIHKSGGGTGFSFSRVRPKDDPVNSTKGVSSGPISFMQVFDAATETVKQGGRRRGANMAILRVDHPDIMDFIHAKEQTSRLNNFNISVAITDVFMDALRSGGEYDLVNPRTREVAGTLMAQEVFDAIVDCAWRTGEPGVVFIDRINDHNPTPSLGEIESTNPCGEQPLLPYESCNLGSINLSRFAVGETGECTIDYDGLERAVSVGVRFLDNVIDMNQYPLPDIDRLTKANRKIGLGVMGFADLLIQLGVPYDSEEAAVVADDVMGRINESARRASRELAVERGAFPNYADSVYASRGEEPIRNATVSTIAPTGSISIIAETSSGVEPLFAIAFIRRVLDGQELVEVNPLFETIARSEGFYSEELMDRIAREGSVHDVEEVPERWRRLFKTAHDITPDAHVRIQAAFQKHTDNAVSKTVNFSHEATSDDVRTVFELAYGLDCKGVTIYRDGSRDQQVLSTGQTQAAPAPVEHGKKTPKPRPDIVEGATQRMGTGCGNLYVTINENGSGPFELFAQIGKAGGCAASQTEAIGRLISLSLRAGVAPHAIAKQLKGVRCPSPAWNHGDKVFSCADAIGQALRRYLETRSERDTETLDLFTEDAPVNRLAGMCMECGSELEFEGGCSVCRACGYSRC